MNISIASGKGGTGKTTLAVNIAYYLANTKNNVCLLDCDVEEPNDHLFINPGKTRESDVMVWRPEWISEKCIACGKCVENCHYNAIVLVKNKILIFNELCHSCGVCKVVCPANAINEVPHSIGKIISAVDEDDCTTLCEAPASQLNNLPFKMDEDDCTTLCEAPASQLNILPFKMDEDDCTTLCEAPASQLNNLPFKMDEDDCTTLCEAPASQLNNLPFKMDEDICATLCEAPASQLNILPFKMDEDDCTTLCEAPASQLNNLPFKMDEDDCTTLCEAPASQLNTLPFKFAYGILNIGETLAPKIVKELKANANNDEINIIDSAPGTGCSVVESLNAADVSVLVTEPTPFGLHDLKLAVKLSLQMKVPTGIVINRSDGKDKIIADFSEKSGVPIIGRIPFDRKYAEAYSRGEILVEKFDEFSEFCMEISENILKLKNSEVSDFIEEKVVEDKQTKISFNEFSNNTNGFKEIVVISGKGGTGKTTITAALAQLSENKILFDADVDAADLHLLLKPEICETQKYYGGRTARINYEKCIDCGLCKQNCHFDTIIKNDDKFYITEGCEGCGLCKIVCPADAIVFKKSLTGKRFISESNSGIMVHAELGIGEENSGKLVSDVRISAAKLADKFKSKFILGDGPPGTGCPVIATVTGTDLILAVTEPTVSGVHDLERVLKLVNHFKVKSIIIINKADLNPDMTEKIHKLADSVNSKVIAEIPFDKNVHDALMVGKTIIEHRKGPAYEIIKNLWDKI